MKCVVGSGFLRGGYLFALTACIIVRQMILIDSKNDSTYFNMGGSSRSFNINWFFFTQKSLFFDCLSIKRNLIIFGGLERRLDCKLHLDLGGLTWLCCRYFAHFDFFYGPCIHRRDPRAVSNFGFVRRRVDTACSFSSNATCQARVPLHTQPI